jgi:hypothetical protein
MVYLEIFSIAIFAYMAFFAIGVLSSSYWLTLIGHPALIGALYLVVGTSVFSNLLNVDTPAGTGISIALAFIAGLLKTRKVTRVKIEALQKSFLLGLFFLLVNFGILVSTSSFFGVGNFDFFNAVQDGRYLEENSSLDSNTFNEVLPLEWSAGIGSRYGISLILAPLNVFLNESSTLVIGQAILILFSSLGFTMLYLLGIRFFSKRSRFVFIATLATNLSSLVIYQVNNQMFGQITALPVVYFLLILALYMKDLKYFSFYFTFTIFGLYILYPSIIAPLGLSLVFFAMIKLKKKEIDWIYFLPMIGFGVTLYILIYSSNFKWPIKMLLSFTLPQTNSSSVNPQADLFPQLTSLIGPGQFIGSIPIPYVGEWGGLILLLSLLSFLSIIYFFFVIKELAEIKSSEYQLLLSFGLGFLLFALYSFLIGNSYVVLKIGTWISPVLILAFIIHLGSVLSSNRIVGLISKSMILAILICSFGISFQQVMRMKEKKSTSFPQLTQPYEVRSIEKYVETHESNYGLLFPTAEEAAWVAVDLMRRSENRYISLGAQNQALSEIEKPNCQAFPARNGLLAINKVIFRSDIIDITPSPEVVRNPSKSLFLNDDWVISELTNFDSILVPYSGMFPPTLNSQISGNPIPDSTSLRWSSGQACFAFYSGTEGKVSFRIPILLGPDAQSKDDFMSSTAVRLRINHVNETFKILNLDQEVNSGWNMVDLRMEQANSSDRARFFKVRADGRELKFAIGSTGYTMRQATK